MYCLGLLDSGNYVLYLYSILRSKGYPAEVIATPCKIAKSSCGYCLKFNCQYKDVVIKESVDAGTPVREIYQVTKVNYKNVYQKIYPWTLKKLLDYGKPKKYCVTIIYSRYE